MSFLTAALVAEGSPVYSEKTVFGAEGPPVSSEKTVSEAKGPPTSTEKVVLVNEGPNVVLPTHAVGSPVSSEKAVLIAEASVSSEIVALEAEEDKRGHGSSDAKTIGVNIYSPTSASPTVAKKVSVSIFSFDEISPNGVQEDAIFGFDEKVSCFKTSWKF